MPLTAKDIHQALAPLANQGQAQKALRFFKSGRGEYAEGDRFLGISVPIAPAGRQPARCQADADRVAAQIKLA